MTVAQKLPITEIPVARPNLLTPPKQKWRIFARIGVWTENKKEKTRAEREYVKIARRYEAEAEKWGNVRHYMRAALLLEKAADCFEEAGKLKRRSTYTDERVWLLIDVIETLESEIRTGRATCEVYSAMAEVYLKLGESENVERFRTAANKMEEEERDNPAYAALCNIYRLQRGMMEARMENDRIRQNGILLEIVDLVPKASENFPEAFKRKMIDWITEEKVGLSATSTYAIDKLVGIKILGHRADSYQEG